MRQECPPEQELAAFNLGELPLAGLQRVAAHLSDCRACEQRIQGLDHLTDRLIAALRQPGTPRPDQTSWSASPSAAPVRAEVRLDFLEPPRDGDELGWLGHYRVTRFLGQGGMGMVLAAEDCQLRRPVALKVLRADLAQDIEARTRFLREARAAAAFRHDHIVTIYQVGQANDTCFLAMELLEGESLASRLEREPRLTVAECIGLARQVADGLAAAHAKGFIHRDIKPDNIWLEPNGRAKLLDFGLVHAPGDAALTKAGYVLGTPSYMAPEQARGEPGQPGADLFSLGCVLFRMLGGRPAFSGPNSMAILTALVVDQPPDLRDLNAEVPAALANLVCQLMSKEPASRPGSAREVSERLQAIAATSSSRGIPASQSKTRRLDVLAAPLPARDRQKRRWLAPALAVAALLLAGLLIYRLEREPEAKGIASSSKSVAVPDTRTKPNLPARPPAEAPLDAWIKKVSGLPPAEQVEAVAAELAKRNPGFDGKLVDFKVEDGAVDSIHITTGKIHDITPVRALTRLSRLRLSGDTAKSGRVVDLSPLAGLRIHTLELHNNRDLHDLSPLRDMPIRYLNLNNTRVTDLSPLAKAPLGWLSLWECPISDLGPLRHTPITELTCVSSFVRDLSPLAGKKLVRLAVQNSPIEDFTVIRDMPLHTISMEFKPWRDEAVLAGIPTLRWINGKNAADFWQDVRGKKLAFEAWCRQVEAMSAADQVREVAERLAAQDARFDPLGVRHQVEGQAVIELTLPGQGLLDLSPVRSLKGLKRLKVSGTAGSRAILDDLWPLRGLPLEELACGHSGVQDLRPLLGMPLHTLDITGTRVADLTPLQDLPLLHLHLSFLPDQAAALRAIKTLRTLNGQPAAEILRR